MSWREFVERVKQRRRDLNTAARRSEREAMDYQLEADAIRAALRRYREMIEKCQQETTDEPESR